jgi:hypothetical protein
MNDEFVDSTISNLKILAMVLKNQKLCVRKGQLTIERCDRMQFLRRWINNDSRDVIIMHIRNTVINAFRIAKAIMDCSSAYNFSEWTLKRVAQELEGTCHGLANLKTTYADDSIMVASLDVLTDRIAINCDEIASYLGGSQGQATANHTQTHHTQTHHTQTTHAQVHAQPSPQPQPQQEAAAQPKGPAAASDADKQQQQVNERGVPRHKQLSGGRE